MHHGRVSIATFDNLGEWTEARRGKVTWLLDCMFCCGFWTSQLSNDCVTLGTVIELTMRLIEEERSTV